MPSAPATARTSSRASQPERLVIERVREIHARIPNTHLVMHGSSSVPQEWLDVIKIWRRYSPDLRRADRGDPGRNKHGVRKVNIDTDLRLVMTGAIRRLLAQKPDEFDPRKFFAAAMDAAKDLCRDRFEAFGSAGQASRIKPLPMERTVGGLRQSGITSPSLFSETHRRPATIQRPWGRPADFSECITPDAAAHWHAARREVPRGNSTQAIGPSAMPSASNRCRKLCPNAASTPVPIM